MMDKTNFPHPTDPTANPKYLALIGKHGAAGYGIYWRLVEMIQSEPIGKIQIRKFLYTALATQMSVFEEQVETMISDMINEYELFSTDGNYFWDDLIQVVAGKKTASTKVATYRVDKELMKEWEKAEKALPAVVVDRWVTIKTFILEKKPEFIEPYASAWNIFALNCKLPQIEAVTDSRKNKFATRIKEQMFDFYKILEVIKKDDFYLGRQNGSTWKVGWDYIFENDTNYLKILEKKN